MHTKTNRLKKTSTAILALCIALALVACNNQTPPSQQQQSPSFELEETQTPQPTQEIEVQTEVDSDLEQQIQQQLSQNQQDEAIKETQQPQGEANNAQSVDMATNSASYAPLKDLQLTYTLNEGGKKTTQVTTTRSAPNSKTKEVKNYLMSVVSKSGEPKVQDYFFDNDGLRIYSSPEFSDGVLVLPFEITAGATWEFSQLLQVENKPSLTCGLNVPVAFVLTTGTEHDTLSAYGQGLGLVAKWDNATGEGEPTIVLSDLVVLKK